MKARATEAVPIVPVDKGHAAAGLGASDGRRVAAWPSTDHEKVGGVGNIADNHHRSLVSNRAGSRTNSVMVLVNAATSAPSMIRWSAVTVSIMTGRTAGDPWTATTRSVIRPNARIATSGQLINGVGNAPALRVEGTDVVHRERPSAHVCGGQATVTGTIGDGLNLSSDLSRATLIRVAQNRHQDPSAVAVAIPMLTSLSTTISWRSSSSLALNRPWLRSATAANLTMNATNVGTGSP